MPYCRWYILYLERNRQCLGTQRPETVEPHLENVVLYMPKEVGDWYDSHSVTHIYILFLASIVVFVSSSLFDPLCFSMLHMDIL